MPKSVILRKRRRMVSITGLSPQQPVPPNRGGTSINAWTTGMAVRLGNFVDNFRQDFVGMVTLTYPKEYPHDGRIIKAQFRAFTERLRRTAWFEKHSFVWFLEFQQRGAPHFHLLLTGWMSKDFVSRAWAEVTGGDPRSCSKVEALRNPDSAGAYARKYALKQNQKVVPQDFENVGRFWGCCGRALDDKGRPRIPCVEASTTFPLNWVVKAVDTFVNSTGHGRMYEHEGGLVFHGTVMETHKLWQFLRAAGLFAEGQEMSRAESLARQLAALRGMRG